MTWEIGANGGFGLAMTWLYFMGWSAYGFETVAAFAPEYHDPESDTPRALRASAAFSVVVYALLPLGIGGTLGTAAVAEDATGIAFYTTASTRSSATPRSADRVPDRGPAAVDEHGDDGRLAGPLRDRAGRHDDEVARAPEPLQRAGDRDDDGRDPQPVPDLLLRLPARHPRRGQHRLPARARVRAERLPAAPQGPAELAAADQAGGGLGADRGAARRGQPGCSSWAAGSSGPEEYGYGMDKTWIGLACSPWASCCTSGGRWSRTAPASSCARRHRRCRRRGAPRPPAPASGA